MCSSGFGRKKPSCHVSDLSPLHWEHHSDRLAGTLTLFHGPPGRLQLAHYKIGHIVPYTFPAVKGNCGFFGCAEAKTPAVRGTPRPKNLEVLLTSLDNGV